ncbi:MAG: stage III sporulation protein AA [Bacillota bacterium]|nr:stage III sporulation protein AA [Bacillota bacterium]
MNHARWWKSIWPYLAPRLREPLKLLPLAVWERLEEIRLRCRRPLSICGAGWQSWVGEGGEPTSEPGRALVVEQEDIARTVELITCHSLYAWEEELSGGFITLPGGHRVGLVGRALVERGAVRGLKQFSGLNFRLARQVVGAADPILPLILDEQTGLPVSTLIVSPPRCGKTTILRDLARQLSDGAPALRGARFQVGIVDERSELAGCVGGVPQWDVGLQTDVLDGCPKAQGIMMLLRGMSPEVIVTDELGREEDADAVAEAAAAGVVVLASAHAGDLEDLRRRPSLHRLLTGGAFRRAVVLSRRRGPGTVEKVEELGHAGTGL